MAVKVVKQPERSRSPVLKGEIFHIVWQASISFTEASKAVFTCMNQRHSLRCNLILSVQKAFSLLYTIINVKRSSV